jgi:hypothetical protein
MDRSNVMGVKANRSSHDSAKILPIVFKKNKTNNTHILYFAVVFNLGILIYFALTKVKNKQIIWTNKDINSNTYNCSLVSILPPHKYSKGLKLKINIPANIEK